jgi:hypothetical protein
MRVGRPGGSPGADGRRGLLGYWICILSGWDLSRQQVGSGWPRRRISRLPMPELRQRFRQPGLNDEGWPAGRKPRGRRAARWRKRVLDLHLIGMGLVSATSRKWVATTTYKPTANKGKGRDNLDQTSISFPCESILDTPQTTVVFVEFSDSGMDTSFTTFPISSCSAPAPKSLSSLFRQSQQTSGLSFSGRARRKGQS